MITDKFSIREQNESKLLQTIIDEKQISRAQLSATTGLNKASVSDITRKLLAEKLIIETGIGSASISGGRKPVWLQFNPEAAYIIGIDIGPDYLDGLLTYANSQIIASITQHQIEITPLTIYDKIEQLVTKLTENIKESPIRIAGMALAIHGLVFKNEILFTPNYDLDTTPLYEELTRRYPFPIYLENEANLAALGEYTFATESRNLISISIHTGVGAGIVEDGKLRLGIHGKAGEIGHNILYPNGRLCPCGNKGCLEQYASNKIIYQEYGKQMKKENVSSDMITRSLRAGDSFTQKLLEKAAFDLGVGISSLCALYDPEVIVINNAIYRKSPEMLAVVKKQLTTHYTRDVIVRNSFLDSQATMLGAISLVLQKYLHIQNLRFANRIPNSKKESE